MRRLGYAIGALLLLALSGCGATTAGPGGTAQPANSGTISREEGGRFIVVVSPKLQHDQPFLGVPNTNFFALRSWIDTRTGEVSHQLYIEDSYFGAKRDWNAASANGQTLRFVPISSNEISCEQNCSYAEEFGAAIPDPVLRASTQGLTVRFTAKSGADKIILVPTEVVRRQLAEVDQARASLPAAAATAPAAAPAAATPPPAAVPLR